MRGLLDGWGDVNELLFVLMDDLVLRQLLGFRGFNDSGLEFQGSKYLFLAWMELVL